MRNSEILLALMECAFEGNLPDDAPSLRECMRLYNLLREEENRANRDLSRALTESIRKSMGIEASKSYGFRPMDAAFATVGGPSGTPAPTEEEIPEIPEDPKSGAPGTPAPTEGESRDEGIAAHEDIEAHGGAPGASLHTADGTPEEPDTADEAAETLDTHTHTHTHGRAGRWGVNRAPPVADAARRTSRSGRKNRGEAKARRFFRAPQAVAHYRMPKDQARRMRLRARNSVGRALQRKKRSMSGCSDSGRIVASDALERWQRPQTGW